MQCLYPPSLLPKKIWINKIKEANKYERKVDIKIIKDDDIGKGIVKKVDYLSVDNGSMHYREIFEQYGISGLSEHPLLV